MNSESVFKVDYKEVIANRESFVLYREPDRERLYVARSCGDYNQTFQHLEELNGQSGYVVAPFKVDENHPIVLIPFDVINGYRLPKESESLSAVVGTTTRQVGVVDEEYARRFELFTGKLRDKEFDKLVLSRSIEKQGIKINDAVEAFLHAIKRYPHSYVYMLYTPQTGCWVGATPEKMLRSRDGLWSTVALAGTQPLLKKKKLPQRWSAKQRKEQEYVAAYIRQQLASMDIKFLEKGPYPAYAGALSHLKTDFYFLPDEDKLGDLLSLLHPTPAVCGLPKEEAYRFILENEGYDRSYYSGFVGLLDPKEETDLYVNLRCMNVQDETLTLYAGGGLLDSSELDDEFQETEKKMHTMLNVLPNDVLK